jgi:hypothetical protein
MAQVKTDKFSITLDRDHYSKQMEIQHWCEEYIGPGGWIPSERYKWLIESTFGYTRMTFKNQRDANWFAMRWL